MRILPTKNLGRFLSKACQQPCYAVRVGWKRGKAYLSYAMGSDKGPSPEALTFFLTHRCNLTCSVCGQCGTSDDELPIKLVTRIVEDVSSFKPNITLFGGEPLLHPDCVEIIRLIKSRGMHCLMITNGALLDQHARELVEAGLDELNVSVDGGRELHDSIRNMPGLFDTIMAGLNEVKRLKTDRNARKPLVNLQCTITKYNCGKLDQLAEVAREVQADSLTYHNLIFMDQSVIEQQKDFDNVLGSSSSAWEGFVMNPEIDPDDLYEELSGIIEGKYPFVVDVYPNLSREGLGEYYGSPNAVPGEYPSRCVSPWVVAYIFPDGEVRPCLNYSYSYGNIGTNSFNEVWNGEDATRFRNSLREAKMFPACARCTELYRY